MTPWLQIIIQALIGGVITGAAAYGAIRVHIAWLRNDIRLIREDVNDLETFVYRRVDDVTLHNKSIFSETLKSSHSNE